MTTEQLFLTDELKAIAEAKEQGQPLWKLIADLGDASPLEHGGYFIFEDQTGVYEPEAINFHPMDGSNFYAMAHRFILERCHMTKYNTVGDNKYHPDHTAWFDQTEQERIERPQDTRGLNAVAEYADLPNIREMLCSADITERALAYQAIADYRGYDNFDSYPLTFKTKAEAKLYLHKHCGQTLDKYELFGTTHVDELTELIESIKPMIDDDYRASDDPDDDTPAIQITIATNNDLDALTHQTGDNSYSGSCYRFPHWAVGTIARDTDAAELAAELLSDLTDLVAQSLS